MKQKITFVVLLKMNTHLVIINGIKEQLFCNDYLVIPGFGGFVLKSSPAHLVASGGMLMPAAKTVSFNAQLKLNDGVLVLWLQAKLNCTNTEALQHLNDFAGFCTSILNTKRRLNIQDIGFFYLDFENNLCFEAQHDVNFKTDSFGLSALSLTELTPEVNVEKVTKSFTDRVITTEPLTETPRAGRTRNYRSLLSPIIIAVLFFSLVSLLVVNSRISGALKSTFLYTSSKSSFVPLNYPELKLVNNQGTSLTYVADANGLASIELEGGKSLLVKVAEQTPANQPKAPASLPVHVSGGDYEVVLGCFSVLQNANRMIKQLAGKNINALVAAKKHKGMYVVSLGSFTSKEEALQKLQEVKDNYPKAWIKKPGN